MTYRVPTTTAVNCTPNPVTYGGTSTCTATVTRSANAGSITGSVTWATTDSGSFTGASCSGNPTSRTCTVTYTPSSVGDGTHNVSATYPGDTNYTGSNGNQNVTVNTKALVPSITADNKEYDGNTDATILTRDVTGVINADVVSLTGGSASFADKNVGNGKTVTGNGFSLNGADAGNYHIAPATANTTANITAKAVAPVFTASDKQYDGTTAATIATRDVTGALGADDVSLTGGSASFADANVGAGKTVTASGFSLSGADAGNYALDPAPVQTAADITPKAVAPVITADDKEYDGNTDASILTRDLTGVIGAEDVSLTGGSASFADANAGAGKTVTGSGFSLSGADAGNYTLAPATANTTADITPKTVTPSFTADDKEYDGTTAASILTRDLTGVIGADDVSLSGGNASFADANVGAGKTVTASGFSLSGADAGNYSVDPAPVQAVADITAKALTVTADDDSKTYDGSPYSGGNGVSFSGFAAGEDETSLGGTLGFSGDSQGAVDAGTYDITPGGLTSSNYAISFVDGTLTIDTKAVAPSFTADDKEYDGTTAASILTRDLAGVIGAEDVTLTGGSASFADANAGAGKTVTASGFSLSGADAGNYHIAPTSAQTTADITAKTLTVTANSKTMITGNPDPAFDFSVDGFIAPDDFVTAPVCDVADPHTAPGTYDIVCSGGDAGANYNINYVNGTLTVNAANAAPTDITLSNASVDENLPAGSTVGTLTSDDPDVGDTFTYSLVDGGLFCPGTDNASFQIVSDVLQTNAMFDYETKNSYVICIQTDDGLGGTFEKEFTITVNNVLEVLKKNFKSQTANDGWILESAEDSGKGGTLNRGATILQLGDDAARKQYVAILSFNTSPIPDNAVITKLTLKVKQQGIIGGGNPVNMFQGFVVDIKRGTFGAPALAVADFQAKAQKTLGPIKRNPNGTGWYVLNITPGKNFINKITTANGLTQLRLRFNLDDNNNNAANILRLFSGNAAAADRPQLIVEYYIP